MGKAYSEHTRRLAAVLSADAVGSSRLSELDEDSSLRLRRSCLRALAAAVVEYGGRVVDTVGDNLLAEFPSAVNAVAGAVEAQRQLNRINEKQPTGQQMPFRIGISFGEVVVAGNRLEGSRVDQAARLEQLAKPGSVAIAGGLYEEISGKLPLRFHDRGVQQLKNMKPAHVWDVEIPTSGEAMPLHGQLLPWRMRTQLTSTRFLAVGVFVTLGGLLLVAAVPPDKFRSAALGGSMGFSLLAAYMFFRHGIEMIPLHQRGYVTIGLVVVLVGFMTVQARGAVQAFSAIFQEPDAGGPVASGQVDLHEPTPVDQPSNIESVPPTSAPTSDVLVAMPSAALSAPPEPVAGAFARVSILSWHRTDSRQSWNEPRRATGWVAVHSSDDESRLITCLTSPADEKGSAVHVVDRPAAALPPEVFVFLPELGKLRRMPPGRLGAGRLFGTGFSYEDLVHILRNSARSCSGLRTENGANRQSFAPRLDGSAYERLTIDWCPLSCLPVRMSFEGALAPGKVLAATPAPELPLEAVPQAWMLEDTDSRTRDEIRIDELRYPTAVPSAIFSLSFLSGGCHLVRFEDRVEE